MGNYLPFCQMTAESGADFAKERTPRHVSIGTCISVIPMPPSTPKYLALPKHHAMSIESNKHCLPAILVVAILLASPFALAADEFSRDVKVTGMGVSRCSDWTHWQESKNLEAQAMVIEWARGFISGHNVYSMPGPNASKSIIADPAALRTLIDNQCRRDPHSHLVFTVAHVIRSLGGIGAEIQLQRSEAPRTNPLPRAADTPNS